MSSTQSTTQAAGNGHVMPPPSLSDKSDKPAVPVTDDRFFTYILRCADGTLYTGWTTDIAKRLAAHNQGKGAKYTRTRLPVTVLASWRFHSKSEAMRFEHWIKQLPRPEKLALLARGDLAPEGIGPPQNGEAGLP